MGDVPHEELANKLLQLNATSPELSSVLRGAHDRILHLATTATVATNSAEVETLQRQLEDANARIDQFSTDLTSALMTSANEKDRADGLQGQVNELNAELQRIRDTYDLDDAEEAESGDEEGGEESKS
jgi:chromosome segregation ATPase